VLYGSSVEASIYADRYTIWDFHFFIVLNISSTDDGTSVQKQINERPSISHKTQPTFIDLEQLLQEDYKFSMNLRSPLQTLGARWVTWDKFDIGDSQFCCILWICIWHFLFDARGYNTFWYKGKKQGLCWKHYYCTKFSLLALCIHCLVFPKFYIVLHQDMQFRFFPDLPKWQSLKCVELRLFNQFCRGKLATACHFLRHSSYHSQSLWDGYTTPFLVLLSSVVMPCSLIRWRHKTVSPSAVYLSQQLCGITNEKTTVFIV
jgi:hypothetical protein